MSSVDGTRSIEAASDELFTIVCDPCNYDGIERQAIRYCQDCKEYLCLNCTESHKRFKNLRNHKILAGKEIPKNASTPHEVSNKILCACDQNLEITDCCEKHKEVFCQTCKTLKHRKCSTTPISDKGHAYLTSQLKVVQEKAQQLKNEFERLQTDRNSDLQHLREMKEKCRKEIESFRNELDTFFDKLEQTLLKELETLETQMLHELERHVSTCSTTLKVVVSDSKLLDNVKKEGQKDQMFVADIKVSNRLKEYETLLKELRKETRPPTLAFEPNTKLVQMQKNIDSFGTLTSEDSEPSKIQSHALLDKKVVASNQVTIKLPSDQKTPWITGCTFMPNGQALLCDYFNHRIKLLDTSLTPKASLKVPEYPWDIAIIDSNTVITSHPAEKKLAMIQVNPNLEGRKTMQFKRQCFGVSVVRNDIYVSFHDAPGAGEIRVIDIHGNVKMTIGQFMSLESPLYISTSTSTGRLYVADYTTSLLSSLTSNGKIIYQYKNPDLFQLKGMYVDEEDNVVVCGGRDTNNIYIISANGKSHKTLLPVKNNIPEPCCVACRQAGDTTLIVGCYENEKLYILTLS